MITLAELHVLIAAVCPIQGVDSTGRIVFWDHATAAERAAAQVVMDANLSKLIV